MDGSVGTILALSIELIAPFLTATMTADVTARSPLRRSGRDTESFRAGVVRRTRRMAKFARRLTLNALQGRTATTRVLFIMGAQRSGTRVPLVALESAPDVLTYREGARPYFRDGRLESDHSLDRLFAACPFPLLVLKPLCESHRAPDLLRRHPGSRVLWIFRGYQDTVRSASLKWSSGPEAVARLVTGRLDPGDWRLGGLTDEALEVARRLYEPGLSRHHADAILWYLRNRLALDLGLFDRQDVLVVRYEDLSTDPVRHFPRVFDFVGQTLRPDYLVDIHARSVRRSPLAGVPGPVAEACETLHDAIERRYRLSIGSRSKA